MMNLMISLEVLRQFRFGPYAIFDFAISYIGVFLFAPLLVRFTKALRLNIQRSHWLWLTLPLSVGIHLLFKQLTPLTVQFTDWNGHYLTKAIILFMTFMGLKDSWKLKSK